MIRWSAKSVRILRIATQGMMAGIIQKHWQRQEPGQSSRLDASKFLLGETWQGK
jgi:hypothetical protein